MTGPTPRAAATVCIVRDHPDGMQVLLAERSLDAPFVPGAFVFPGGAVDPQDRLAPDPHKAAVVRETFEEVGIVLANHGETVTDRGQELFSQLPLSTFSWADVVYVSTWVTPAWMGLRFDTKFYVAAAPDGSAPVVDGHELVSAGWFSPQAALAQSAAGAMPLISPTVAHLRYLRHYDTVSAALIGAGAGLHASALDQSLIEGSPQ